MLEAFTQAAKQALPAYPIAIASTMAAKAVEGFFTNPWLDTFVPLAPAVIIVAGSALLVRKFHNRRHSHHAPG